MVWSSGAVAVEFRDVLQSHWFSVLTLYTLSFRFDKLLSEIDNVLQKQDSLT